MSQYRDLDKRIILSIQAKKNPLYEAIVLQEADRISAATGRENFRVVDGRLQALRKAGKIVHLTKAESNGSGGWKVKA